MNLGIKMEANQILTMEDSDDITVLLKNWEVISQLKRDIILNEEKINNKIKAYLKERKWTKYKDEDSQISVTITQQTRESFDKQQLQSMLSDTQYRQVVKITTFEKMQIATAKTRENIQKFLDKKKR